MMTDQELIDGLRAELRQVQVPNDLLERVQAAADNDAPQTTRRPGRQAGWSSRSVRSWVAGGASLAVVGVIVAIVLSVGHRGQAPPSTVSATDSDRAQLVSSFAVLRRRQTATDLQPRLFLYHQPEHLSRAQMERARSIPFSDLPTQERNSGYAELDRPLTRVVSFPGSHTEVMIAPATFHVPHGAEPRTLGVDLTIGTNGVGRSGTGPRPTTVASVLANGLAVTAPDPTRPSERVALLVPDGVKRVRLSDLRPGSLLPGIRRRVATQTHRIAVVGIVRDNLALVHVPSPTVALSHADANTLPFATFATAQAAWIGADGSVIGRRKIRVGLTVHFTRPGRHATPPASSAFCKANPDAC
jgi:hypothetical protein